MRGDEDKVVFPPSFLLSNGIDLLLHFLAQSKPLVNVFRILLLNYSLDSVGFLFNAAELQTRRITFGIQFVSGMDEKTQKNKTKQKKNKARWVDKCF